MNETDKKEKQPTKDETLRQLYEKMLLAYLKDRGKPLNPLNPKEIIDFGYVCSFNGYNQACIEGQNV